MTCRQANRSTSVLFVLRGMAALVLWMWWFAPVTLHAAAAGSVSPMPSGAALLPTPPKPVETRRMQNPGLIGEDAVRQDMVHLLFPQDGAQFPSQGIITLGWMPPTEEVLVDLVRNSPVFYEVVVSREGTWSTTLRISVSEQKNVLSGLVMPPGPGRYQWQVYSIMPDGQRISSANRVFTVLP